MYARLDVPVLRRIAAQHGDRTGYAIARRTGLPESTVHRTLHMQTAPGLPTISRMAAAYGVTVAELLTSTEEVAAA